MNSIARMLWWLSAGYRSALVKSAIGAIVAIGLTVGICSLGNGARNAIQEELITGGGQFRVKAPAYNIGPINLSGSVVKEKELGPNEVQALSDLDGIERVLPEVWSRFPVSFRAKIQGQRIFSDGALLGVSPEGIGDDYPASAWTWKEGDPVPILAPRSLLMAYNGGFAPANGLPKFNEKAVHAFPAITIVAGKSSHKGRGGKNVKLQGQIVGVTAYGGALAAIIPIDTIRHIEQALGSSEKDTLSSVLVTLRPGANIEEVTTQIEALGWAVEPLDGAAKQLATAIKTVDLGVRVGGTLLALGALFLLVQFYGVLLRERTQDLRILRSMGAPRKLLATTLFGEVALASLVATILGIGLGLVFGHIAASQTDGLLASRLGVDLQLAPSVPIGFLATLLLVAPIFVAIAAAPAIRRALSAQLMSD